MADINGRDLAAVTTLLDGEPARYAKTIGSMIRDLGGVLLDGQRAAPLRSAIFDAIERAFIDGALAEYQRRNRLDRHAELAQRSFNTARRDDEGSDS